jgi:anaerobic selenocysteine-containing dehydrogenase
METPPSTDELLRIRLDRAIVSLDELTDDLETHPAGRLYDHPSAIVQPARADADARFDVMPADVAGEVRELLASPILREPGPGAGFTHLLCTRRMNHVMNTQGMTMDGTLSRAPHNPAYLHPEDLAELGLAAGDEVAIASAHGRIEAVAAADATVRPGVVSIAHAWGGLPGRPGPGVNVNRLIDATSELQAINAMPRMSAVPVTITKVPVEVLVAVGAERDEDEP